MKEEINLLAPAAKRVRLQMLLTRRLLYLGRRLLLVWALVWVVFAIVFWATWQRKAAIAAQLAAQQTFQAEAALNVQEVNELMGVVARWVDTHSPWTPLLADVIRTVPPEARLEVLALTGAEDSLLIKGVSTSRAAVVDMQRGLEQLAWVASVEAPLQNFAAGPSSEFSFTLHRKPPAP